MICYRDKTFCTAPCAQTTCPRMLTDEVRAAAEEWWKSFAITPDRPTPIAAADMSGVCLLFRPIEEYQE